MGLGECKILRHVSEHIPYYAKLNLNIDEDGSFATEVAKFPLCNKQLIKEQQIEFVDYGNSKEKFKKIFEDQRYVFDKQYCIENAMIVAEYTSGTTGSPFVTIKTDNERVKLGKNLWKLRKGICGVKPNDLFDFIHSVPFRNVKFSSDRDRKIQELEYLSTAPYTWWHTTSRVLEGYKQLVIDNHFRFPNLKVIENNGSYISSTEREEYEKLFDCKVVDNYGSRELWTIAYSCKCGLLHVNSENVLFELLDDENERIEADNVPGRVVLTSKNLSLMPFVRYQIGDVAEYIPCDCGHKDRAIRLVPGRNYIKGTNLYGNKYFKDIILALALKYNLKKYDSITIVQNDYKKFTVNIVNNQEKPESLEKAFVSVAKSVFEGYDFEFSFTYGDNEKRKSIFTVGFN